LIDKIGISVEKNLIGPLTKEEFETKCKGLHVAKKFNVYKSLPELE